MAYTISDIEHESLCRIAELECDIWKVIYSKHDNGIALAEIAAAANGVSLKATQMILKEINKTDDQVSDKANPVNPVVEGGGK